MKAQKAEEERIALEKRMKEMEEKRKKQLEELRNKEEEERKRKEEEFAELERKRKEELYASMKRIKEETRRKEAAEREELEKDWLLREKCAKEAEQNRRNSFTQAKSEMRRLAKIAKEKAAKTTAALKMNDGTDEKSTTTATAQSPKTRKSFS